MKLIVIFLLLCSSSLYQANALDTNPPLKETINWLQNKIEHEAGYEWEDINRQRQYTFRVLDAEGEKNNKPIDFNNITITSLDEVDYKSVQVISYDIPLKELDPSRVVVQKRDGHTSLYQVVLPATYKRSSTVRRDDIRQPINYSSGVNEFVEDSTGKTGRVLIDFTDESVANRVAKAFSYLIRLSGGKSSDAEPF